MRVCDFCIQSDEVWSWACGTLTPLSGTSWVLWSPPTTCHLTGGCPSSSPASSLPSWASSASSSLLNVGILRRFCYDVCLSIDVKSSLAFIWNKQDSKGTLRSHHIINRGGAFKYICRLLYEILITFYSWCVWCVCACGLVCNFAASEWFEFFVFSYQTQMIWKLPPLKMPSIITRQVHTQ